MLLGAPSLGTQLPACPEAPRRGPGGHSWTHTSLCSADLGRGAEACGFHRILSAGRYAFSPGPAALLAAQGLVLRLSWIRLVQRQFWLLRAAQTLPLGTGCGQFWGQAQGTGVHRGRFWEPQECLTSSSCRLRRMHPEPNREPMGHAQNRVPSEEKVLKHREGGQDSVHVG